MFICVSALLQSQQFLLLRIFVNATVVLAHKQNKMLRENDRYRQREKKRVEREKNVTVCCEIIGHWFDFLYFSVEVIKVI